MVPIKQARNNFGKSDNLHSQITIFELQKFGSLISNNKEFTFHIVHASRFF